MQLSSFEDVLNNKVVKFIMILVLSVFTVLTVITLLKTPVTMLFKTQLSTIGGIQIYFDLVIMCLVFSIWIKMDSKRNNRKFLPWFFLTLIAGAIGPLLYIATRKKS